MRGVVFRLLGFSLFFLKNLLNDGNISALETQTCKSLLPVWKIALSFSSLQMVFARDLLELSILLIGCFFAFCSGTLGPVFTFLVDSNSYQLLGSDRSNSYHFPVPLEHDVVRRGVITQSCRQRWHPFRSQLSWRCWVAAGVVPLVPVCFLRLLSQLQITGASSQMNFLFI